jgi:hypothetical protein
MSCMWSRRLLHVSAAAIRQTLGAFRDAQA